MQTTTEWAVEHGREFAWSAVLDNHEPPRDHAYGKGWEYGCIDSDREAGIVLEDVSELRDATKAIYLIDDGRRVRPFYVVSYHPEQPHLILHPFPTDFHEDGEPRMRADRPEQVDFSLWSMGPRRTYHLKVRP